MRKIVLVSVLSLSVVSPLPAHAGWRTNLVIAGGGFIAKEFAVACLKSPACLGRGMELAAQGLIAVISAYGVNKVQACMKEPSCRDVMVAAIAKGADVSAILSTPTDQLDKKPAPGDGLEPPGDCLPENLSRMTEQVTKWCKKISRACKKEDSLLTLQAKAAAGEACVAARSRREDQCYRGGDRDHRDQIEQRKNQVKNCYEYMAEKQ